MTSRRTLRSLPGHIAFVMAALVATAAAVTGVSSFFYESWGQGTATAAGYLVPPALLIAACALCGIRPRAGGFLLLAGGALALGWWLWTRRASHGLTAPVLVTAVVFFAPILLTGGLFLLEARHRQALAEQGALLTRGWWKRNYRPALIAAVPLAVVALGPARQLPGLLARYDDGLRGARTIAGNGVTLVWAPQGPGWNQRQPDGLYPSWNAIAEYGGSGAGLCGHLSEDGRSLLPNAVRVWRLPTVAEVVRSLTLGGTNAGCTWDGRSPHATCAKPPDKETPLWAPDQRPIYYLTSNAPDADVALGVNYTGGVTPHRRTVAGGGVGYRCVKSATVAGAVRTGLGIRDQGGSP